MSISSDELLRSRLLAFLQSKFDMEELKTLCFQLGVDFEKLTGEGKNGKARELILYLERRSGKLDELLIHLVQGERSEDFRQSVLPDDPELYQKLQAAPPVVHPAPAPATTLPDTPRHNLPAQYTPFVGREQEVVAVQDLLRQEDVRLVTLVGPGGVGKTRLALQVATKVAHGFKQGVFLIALAPIRDPNLVVSTIAQTLGIKEASGQSHFDSLKSYLRDKQMLLVLDNFEHVIEAAPVVTELLAAAPSLEVIVTSRAVLKLSGENEFPVPPLPVPDMKHPPSIDVLPGYAAIALFVLRARAVKREFQLTQENARAVAEICVRLDGLPLAIELAAAGVKLFSPQALLEQLPSHLEHLTDGRRDAHARHQTLGATIDWSYNLLTADEQTLFRRLATFVGGCTLEAVEAVAGDWAVARDNSQPPIPQNQSPSSILDRLAALVDKSLLQQVEGVGGKPRFVMLETIREYAYDKLTESGEAATVHARHGDYFFQLVEEAQPQLQGLQEVAWFKRLEAEHDNLRGALEWSIDNNVEAGLKLAGMLSEFWDTAGYLSEGRHWLEIALAKEKGSVELSSRSESLANVARLGIAQLALRQGEYEQVVTIVDEVLAWARERGDKRILADALFWRAMVAAYTGDVARAIPLLEESLALARELQAPVILMSALQCLTFAETLHGNFERATAVGEECLALARERGTVQGIALTLNLLAYPPLLSGDNARAAHLFRESLVHYRKTIERVNIVFPLMGSAWVSARQNRPVDATRLFGAAEALREVIGSVMPPAIVPVVEAVVADVRAQLDGPTFARAWAEGRAMTLEQAIEYALTDT